MLPSLSSNLGAKLQLVLPAPSDPADVSARRHAVLKLKEVVGVRVLSHTGRGDDVRYTLKSTTNAGSSYACAAIEEQSGNTTPSTTSGSASEGTAESVESSHRSAFQTEKRLEDFVDFSNEVYHAAHMAHRQHTCQFCTQVALYVVVVAPKPDSFMLRLLGKERAMRKLTQFTTGLLKLVVDHLGIEASSDCAAKMRIPQILCQFLFTATTDASEVA